MQIDWIPFYKRPLYPEISGGSDYVEKASPNTLWLWPDRMFFRFSAHVLPFAMKQENSYIKIIS